MNKLYAIMYILNIAFGHFYQICEAGQPPYQVSLHKHLHPKTKPVHICNGIILQSRVILTSAECVFHDPDFNEPWIPIQPSKLSVVAGNADEFHDAAVYSVSQIIVSNKFNSTTMENDLAILRLSTSLPLNSREDMSWIVLDDDEFENNPCLASFSSRNSMDNIPNYTQTEELPILASQECTQFTRFHSRKQDLCSYYILPVGFKCKHFDEFIHFNADRGTGLVCNSRLVAVLSTILSLPQHGDNCSETLVKALYTNIGPHLDWIYSIIAYEEYIDITRGKYTASSPYQQVASAIIQPSIIDSESNFSTIEITSTPSSTTTDNSFTTTHKIYYTTSATEIPEISRKIILCALIYVVLVNTALYAL